MLKKLVLTLFALMFGFSVYAAQNIQLFSGEIKILKLANIERIAVGSPDVISNSLLNDGQLILIGEGQGTTDLKIWFTDGSKRDYKITVIEKAGNLVQRKNEVANLLSDIYGIEVSIVGDRIVLTGEIGFGHEDTINTVRETYEEVVVNVNSTNELGRKKAEIEDLLSEVEGLNVRIVGERIALSGLIDNGFDEAITAIEGVYPELLDLTQRASLDVNMPDNKMVLMNIKITEFNRNFLENLGILWDTSINGFSGGAALTVKDNDTFRAVNEATPTSFEATLLPGAGSSPLGYFGIASEITSRINFAVNSGNALILAEPRLAARSGGEATFLSGGEFPIQISNINGTTIEFKEFGIQLSVTPEVDRNDNIRAKVSTELSSINNAVAVDGVPGLSTRRTEADVILQSGETLVMSGLINQEASKDITGIKFLKDIPILGRLFSSETFRDNKSELVIFVSPQVFDADDQLNSDAVDYVNEGIENVIEAIEEKSLDIVY